MHNEYTILVWDRITGYTSCTSAPLLFAPGGVNATGGSPATTPSNHDGTAFEAVLPVRLGQPALDSIVGAARSRWDASGLTPEQVRFLRNVIVSVSDMPAGHLGSRAKGHITIDDNAGGSGWFVDATPQDDVEFSKAVSPTRLYTTPPELPAGHSDLLTAVLHEMGHQLGLVDSYSPADRDSLMFGHLTVGERRLPSRAEISAGAAPEALDLVASGLEPMAADPFTLAIGTLPTGKSVTITYEVDISPSPVLGSGFSLSAQGSVAATGLGTTLTDDPDTPAIGDATVTPLDCPTIIVNPATLPNGRRNTAYAPVTFTQTGAIGTATFTLTGPLPAGMTFVNGVLSGTPTAAGTFNITVNASDGNSCGGSRAYALFIELGPPTIATTTGGGSPNLSATSSFFRIQGTAGDDGSITRIAWTTDRGFSGDASFAVADMAADDGFLNRGSAPNPGSVVPWGPDAHSTSSQAAHLRALAAPVTVNWAADLPLLTGANVVTFTATDNDGLTTSVQVTVTVSTLTYYLAEGAAGTMFDTYILLGNATTTPAPVTMTFYTDDGTTQTHNMTVAPTSRMTVPVDGIAGMTNAFFATKVVSTLAVPLAVERSTYWDSRYLAGHAAVATDQLRTRWTFAEGTTEGLTTAAGRVPFMETYLLLANPGATAATVTIRSLLTGGGVVTRTAFVAPGSRLTVPSAGYPGLNDQAFGMEVTSDAPIAAARSLYFGNFRGGQSSEGATPSATWFYSEIPTGPFYDSFLLLANPNATPATVTVTYYPDLGAPVVRTKTVAANERLTVYVDGEDPAVANTTLWMRVVANQPIAAERSVFWPGPAGTWVESHGGTGAPEPGVHWTLAEGAVGGLLNFQTFVLIANPSALDATVQVTYLRDNGTTVVKTYSVLALQRRVVHVNGLVPELNNEGFALDIRSTNGVPILIERSLYWNGYTSVTGVRVP